MVNLGKLSGTGEQPRVIFRNEVPVSDLLPHISEFLGDDFVCVTEGGEYRFRHSAYKKERAPCGIVITYEYLSAEIRVGNDRLGLRFEAIVYRYDFLEYMQNLADGFALSFEDELDGRPCTIILRGMKPLREAGWIGRLWRVPVVI